MIKFGASFGFAVMGRISLLIGRFEDLINYSTQEYYYSTFIILFIMIVSLGFWSIFMKEEARINIEEKYTNRNPGDTISFSFQ